MKKTQKYGLFLFFLLGFYGAGGPLYAQQPVRVVASFSILGDMVAQIGGAEVALTTLVGPAQDPHSFDPVPAQVSALTQAEIIVINGLHFEPWMNRLIKASQTKAKLLVASAKIKPLYLQGDEKIPDPHAWQDLEMAQQYVRNIASALIAARPDKAEIFRQRAKQYNERLQTLHTQAKEAFDAIPPVLRKAVTDHQAFNYLGAAYGVDFYALQGVDTHDQPTYADIKRLTDLIAKKNIKLAFTQAMTDPRLLKQIVEATGLTLAGELYADALSEPQGRAGTYEAMMRANLRTILTALGQKPDF
ncbi:MAG: zinc ABC transporter substrate-binding protein [Alphaproteobacteria bacterium]|nr:zinc ABC transporter substrate-binding protein [Alphaproteobacteria bacterium]